MSNILIVDDSEIWRRLSKQVLSTGSRRISEAESGEHAVELARVAAPDLVVMDYGMPGLDGLQTSQLLRALPGFKQTPIILLTAEDFPGNCEATPAPFVDGYVDKKRIHLDLAACVEQHLDRASASV